MTTLVSTFASDFARDGFAIVPGVLSDEALAAIDLALADAGGRRDTVGTRALLAEPWCAALAGSLRDDARIAAALPRDHVAVQCTSFEKSVDRNWLVPIHQDVSIPVAARVEDAALAGWSFKEGTWHVQPPEHVLDRLVAIRVHLDDCTGRDGPLLVVPGSHRAGRVSDEVARAARRTTSLRACPVDRGGAMLMRPLLLHASAKASGTSRRRVLHFLLGPRDLPSGLRWPGLVAAAA